MLNAIIILSITVCLAIAVGVWLIVKRSMKARRVPPESIGGQGGTNERRSMETGDWANAAVSIVLGVLLGVSLNGLAELVTTAFWPVVVAIPLIFAGVFFLEWVAEKLVDRVFPSGVRPARQQKAEGRKPLPRLLSLPVGIGIGVALAQLGLDDQILGLIP